MKNYAQVYVERSLEAAEVYCALAQKLRLRLKKIPELPTNTVNYP